MAHIRKEFRRLGVQLGLMHCQGLMMTELHGDAYALFREAIRHRDAEAWAAICTSYRPLLVAWAYRSIANACVGERAEDIADQALARAWAALSPERLADFPTLARLLAYLRTCVATTAIDVIRASASVESSAWIDARADASPDQIVLAELDRDTLWCAALALAATPAERVVLVESFAHGLPPRAIRARHPRLFADVAAVYRTKRNLLDRLQHNGALLQEAVERVYSI